MLKRKTIKESAQIHYLKTARKVDAGPVVTPPSPQAPQAQTITQDDFLKSLQQKIERMEKDFQDALAKLESKKIIEPSLEHATRDEISSLTRRLEEKIQKISDEVRQRPISAEKLRLPSQDGQAFLDWLKEMIFLKPFQDFLDRYWFSPQSDLYEVDEFGMDPAFAKKVKPLFDFLYYQYWRVSVKGIQNIPHKGRGLIVANHSGTLPYDGSMIRVAAENDHPSRRDVRFLVEDFVYHFPFLGTFMYRIGGVRACPENAERLLNKEHLVAVFPEGVKGIGKHYKNRYRLQRFGRGGFIKLALRTKSPIIPTAVIGAEEIHPLIYKSTLLARPLGVPYLPITPTLPALGPLGLIPLPSKWTIVFGEPIQFAPQYGPKDAEDQLLVNQLSEKIRETIQQMIIEALKNRRSVWFG